MPKVCHSTMNSEHMPVDVNVEHLLKVLRYDIEKTALCLVLLEVMGQEPADCNLGLVGEHVDSVRRELRKALGLEAERF
jgi:hypothetical protein